MTTCTCSGTTATITFAASVTLLRCTRCGAQSWVLDGRPVPADVAHTALRGSFAGHRQDPSAPRGPRRVTVHAPQRVVDLRDAALAPQATSADLQAALDEVLARKGVPGTWQLTS